MHLALTKFQRWVKGAYAAREWAYDRESPIGKLDKGLDKATAKGWSVVNMKVDWKRVYAFETP